MRVLGLSAYYHDSAAALIEDGIIMAAVQEERFSRRKHDAGFPSQALRYCLGQATGPVDAVVYYEKPILKFERILATALTVAPGGFRAFAAAMPDWLHQKLWLPGVIEDGLVAAGAGRLPVFFSTHHEAHAASAFFPSPFDRAAILTLDGVGEWTTTALGQGHGPEIILHRELRFPHSLGLLYSAFTHYCGFRVNSGEYKLMGLAPYGEPRFAGQIRSQLLDLRADGSFALDLDYFGYLHGQTMTNRRFDRLFGAPARAPEAPLSAFYCDVAASIQVVTEEIILRLARTLHRDTGEENLCLAGGVALNCVANARLQRESPFKSIWVQPAAGDAGGALGAALAYYHRQTGVRRLADGRHDAMQGALLGPAFTDDEVAAALRAHGLVAERLDPAAQAERIAEHLDAGAVVGFCQGRAEFGPRALGARSILADARRPEMQSRLNLKIKFRESFRPFAPIVLAERAAEYFDLPAPSPYMMFTAPLAAGQRRAAPPATRWEDRLKGVRSSVPAVTHVDFSARVQTVAADTHPHLHRVLLAFATRTGCPVLVNTSYNIRGEPPVCHPREALAGFLATGMDCLALGPYWLEKRLVPAALLQAAALNRTFSPD